MARWRDRPEPGVPAWVVETDPSDPGWPLVEAWLDELQDRDPEAAFAAIVQMISTPAYTVEA